MSTPARLLMLLGDTVPTPPAEGQLLLYAKSDGNFYALDSEGIERMIGSGTSSGTVTSVALESLTPALTVTGSPVSNNGIIAINANPFTDLTPGIVPAPNGVVNNFLRSDGTWATVQSSGGGSQGPGGSVQIADGVGGFLGLPLGQEGRVLTAQGSTEPPTWEPIPVSGGTVTAVDIDGGLTGLTFSGGPITLDGTFSVGGILNIAYGGTGGTSPKDAMINLLPDQTDNPGAALTTDGNGNLSWVVPAGSAYVEGLGIKFTGNIISTDLVNINPDSGGAPFQVQVSNEEGKLTGITAGDVGTVLVSTGYDSTPIWSASVGTVTEINLLKDPATGLFIGGGVPNPENPDVNHITTAGDIYIAGTLSKRNGGTGTNAEGFNEVIFEAAFPDPTGNANKFLMTDGIGVSWEIPQGLAGTVTSVNISGGDTGLEFLDGPITTSGTIGLGGVLGVGFGGTGATEAQQALNNLLPNQTGQSGKILTTDGENAIWTTTAAGSVTSIDINPGDTGLEFIGGPITSSGVFEVGGALNVSNGGTGSNTPQGAMTNLLPSQTGNAGKSLLTDGAGAVYWGVPSGLDGTVTSVDVSGGITGMTFTGGPVTSSGIIELGGVLNVFNGGTGANNPTAASKNILPDQSGQAGKILTTDGNNVLWTATGAGSVTSVGIIPGTTGFTFTGSPITSAGNIMIGGQLSILNGGTGASSALDARNNLMPPQDTYAGKFLMTDGVNMSWQTPPGSAATVYSVDVSGGTTGLTFTGGPITTTGTISAGGILNVVNGGTGASTTSGALNNLLPTQTGQSGKFLSTNGTTTSWQTMTSTAGGGDTQVQFNNNGVLGSSANLFVNKTTGALTCVERITGSSIYASGDNGVAKPIVFATNGSMRWELRSNATTESGTATGSNFVFTAYNNSGVTAGIVYDVSRETQILDFKKTPTINGVQIGYLNLPVTTTFNADAKGKRVSIATGFTVPANTYAAGDAFSFYNNSAANITITQGSGLTLRLDGTTSTGNRTLLARGTCFLWFLTATEAILSGSVT